MLWSVGWYRICVFGVFRVIFASLPQPNRTHFCFLSFNYMFFFFFLGSGPWWNRRGQSPVEYRGNLYVPYVHISIRPPPPGSSEADPGLSDGWTDGRVDGTYRFPLYSTGLCPLQFPQGPLPCLHNSYHDEIPEQGKGTDDHLLPLGDWLISLIQNLVSGIASRAMIVDHQSVIFFLMILYIL